MVTDLVQIRRLAEMEEGENLRFRRFLKEHHYPQGLFHRIAREVEQQIDCKACANCCREPRVNVSRQDIDMLARYLDMPSDQVIKEYTVVNPKDRETVLRQTKDGCVFLHRNLCLVYEARPRACREFPYLVSDQRSLGSRMSPSRIELTIGTKRKQFDITTRVVPLAPSVGDHPAPVIPLRSVLSALKSGGG